jgi:hypothetical protein
VALTAVSDTLTANNRRNLLIAQRRADDVHSGGRRDLGELSLVRKGQVPFNDALEEGVCTENWIRLDARQRLGNPAT